MPSVFLRQTLYSQNSLLVLAPISRQDELYGLCGAFNGDVADDFTTSDGAVTTDMAEFTTSYQVGLCGCSVCMRGRG